MFPYVTRMSFCLLLLGAATSFADPDPAVPTPPPTLAGIEFVDVPNIGAIPRPAAIPVSTIAQDFSEYVIALPADGKWKGLIRHGGKLFAFSDISVSNFRPVKGGRSLLENGYNIKICHDPAQLRNAGFPESSVALVLSGRQAEPNLTLITLTDIFDASLVDGKVVQECSSCAGPVEGSIFGCSKCVVCQGAGPRDPNEDLHRPKGRSRPAGRPEGQAHGTSRTHS